MIERLFNLLLVFLAATLMTLAGCTGNTDDATNSGDTEKHGTMNEQIDSTREAGPNGPGVQPADTPATVGP